jgi:hypothetical protein
VATDAAGSDPTPAVVRVQVIGTDRA